MLFVDKYEQLEKELGDSSVPLFNEEHNKLNREIDPFRKIFKASVMTLLYNVSLSGFIEKIETLYKENDKEVTYLSTELREVLKKMTSKEFCVALFKWLREESPVSFIFSFFKKIINFAVEEKVPYQIKLWDAGYSMFIQKKETKRIGIPGLRKQVNFTLLVAAVDKVRMRNSVVPNTFHFFDSFIARICIMYIREKVGDRIAFLLIHDCFKISPVYALLLKEAYSYAFDRLLSLNMLDFCEIFVFEGSSLSDEKKEVLLSLIKKELITLERAYQKCFYYNSVS